jgi:hypothetical protein
VVHWAKPADLPEPTDKREKPEPLTRVDLWPIPRGSAIRFGFYLGGTKQTLGREDGGKQGADQEWAILEGPHD